MRAAIGFILSAACFAGAYGIMQALWYEEIAVVALCILGGWLAGQSGEAV